MPYKNLTYQEREEIYKKQRVGIRKLKEDRKLNELWTSTYLEMYDRDEKVIYKKKDYSIIDYDGNNLVLRQCGEIEDITINVPKDKVKYKDGFTGSEIQFWICLMDEAYNAKDENTLENIAHDITTSGKDQRKLFFMKLSIRQQFPKKNGKAMQKILDEIKTYEIADIVLEAIEGSKHIVHLPIGYAASKKRKQGKRSQRNTQYTYEQAIRRNRHILEKLLQKDCGIGVNKSERISQILNYI